MKKIVLIDADSLLYKGIEDIGEYQDVMDNIISQIVTDTKATHYRVVLEAPNNYTFRKILNPSYKINRQNYELPVNFKEIKSYIIDYYNAYLAVGLESDDVIATTLRYLKEEHPSTEVIIAVNDKDYKTIPCTIYDIYYGRFGEITFVDKEKAKYNFCMQLLMGDSVDGVKGLKGIGVSKASKILEWSLSPFRDVMREYQRVYGKRYKKELKKTLELIKLRQDTRPIKTFDEVKFEKQ